MCPVKFGKVQARKNPYIFKCILSCPLDINIFQSLSLQNEKVTIDYVILSIHVGYTITSIYWRKHPDRLQHKINQDKHFHDLCYIKRTDMLLCETNGEQQTKRKALLVYCKSKDDLGRNINTKISIKRIMDIIPSLCKLKSRIIIFRIAIKCCIL